jgi:hypothetical protein
MQPTDPYAAPQAGAPTVDARSKVNLPAILILASQVLGLVVQASFFLFKGAIQAALQAYAAGAGKPLPPGALDSNPILVAIGVLGSCFVIYAMLEMRKVRRFPIAVTGAILAMLPVGSLCCCFGLPLGIWALVVLFNADVRAAFT